MEHYRFENETVTIVKVELHPKSVASELYGPEFYRLSNGNLIRKWYFDRHAEPMASEQLEIFDENK